MSFPAGLAAVVFDLDGTLLDTAPEFVEVVKRLRAEHGQQPLPHQRVREVVSDGARAMVSLALDLPLTHPDFEDKRQRFLALYAEHLGLATQPYPGIPALLQSLAAAGVSWGISTNKPSFLTLPLLQRIDLTPAPGSVVCPDHVDNPKPHPEPLLLNARQLGCTPGGCVYVGDHRRDILAGKAAGMVTIAAAYGYVHRDDDPHSWGADAVAERAEDLPELLRAVTIPG
ncbi:MAG: HAD-IA family hydrolase [Halieaceae bacterium]|jgi:phosphoglycolate phosphatase|nr:HAD-IA family hydrolase [Halieaceae bacterium]